MIRLKELREAKHMSQQAVADVFHVTRQESCRGRTQYGEYHRHCVGAWLH